jgi:hypothetical protein
MKHDNRLNTENCTFIVGCKDLFMWEGALTKLLYIWDCKYTIYMCNTDEDGDLQRVLNNFSRDTIDYAHYLREFNWIGDFDLDRNKMKNDSFGTIFNAIKASEFEMNKIQEEERREKARLEKVRGYVVRDGRAYLTSNL